MKELLLQFQGELIAIGFALLLSWGATEMVKRFTRELIEEMDGKIALFTRFAAFVFGVFGVYMMWPEESVYYPIVPGLVVGFLSPTAYWILIFLIRKRWPGLADKLTGSKKWD